MCNLSNNQIENKAVLTPEKGESTVKHTLTVHYVSLSITFVMTKLNAGIDLNRIVRWLLKEMGAHAEPAGEGRASPDGAGWDNRAGRAGG